MNPHGGRRIGLHLLRKIQPIFDSAGIKLDIIETQFAGHAGLIIISGDGTMHEVLNGLVVCKDQRTIPIGLIPGGSGNSLMVDLGLTDPVDAAKAIVAGHLRKFDVAEITTGGRTIFSSNIIGWGLATDDREATCECCCNPID